MARKPSKADLVVQDMLFAEEDLAAMRPALAVAPELVLQALQRQSKRRPRKAAKKKVKVRKSAAKKKTKTKSAPKKKAKRATRKK